MKRCACCMHVTRENFKCAPCTCRLQGWLCGHSQRLGLLQISKLLEKPLMVMCLMSNDFNVFKIHVMMTFLNMHIRLELWSNIKTAFLCSHLQWSFDLAIVNEITLTAIHSVHYSRWWTVGFIRYCFGRGKRLLMVLCGLYETCILCCFSKRPILSETPLTYMDYKTIGGIGLVGFVASALSHSLIKRPKSELFLTV